MAGLDDSIDKTSPLKFQLNGFGGADKKFIKRTLLNNFSGIFNLSSKIDRDKQQKIKNYLNGNYGKYDFELKDQVPNTIIYFSMIAS